MSGKKSFHKGAILSENMYTYIHIKKNIYRKLTFKAKNPKAYSNGKFL
jgi:hypothetical protein